MFHGCKKLFRSAGLEQLVTNPRICDVDAKIGDHSIERVENMLNGALVSFFFTEALIVEVFVEILHMLFLLIFLLISR